MWEAVVMELIVVSVISTIGALIGLIYLDKSFYRRLQWKQDYEKEMLRLKKRESRKDKKLAATINTKAPSTKGDTIKGLIGALGNDGVQELISRFGGGDETDEDFGDIDGLINFASKNPELVQGFLKGLGKEKDKTETDLYE